MEKENKILKIGLLFYICSIIGYFYEMVLCFIYNGKFISHGILYGPWLPIYGTGAILISLLSKYKKHPFIIFILSFFLTGILEGICGFILLKFFKIRLWDYEGKFLNIGGFVCFLSALCFAIGGLLVIYLLTPLINKIIKKFHNKIIRNILLIISLIFLSDVILTILK